MNPGVLRCPSCGAPTGHEDASCAHCRAPLHPVRCPWCFGWTYRESAGCARCGSAPEARADVPSLSCPSCRVPLTTRALGRARLSGCPGCGGVWADAGSFRVVCEDRETRTAYLGATAPVGGPARFDPQSSAVVYRPCAECAELMNRFNFAECSGVILDACKPHGVWFDADELRRIVEFIRTGGLDAAREKERKRLEYERARAEADAAAAELLPPIGPASILSARDLLRHLFDKGA